MHPPATSLRVKNLSAPDRTLDEVCHDRPLISAPRRSARPPVEATPVLPGPPQAAAREGGLLLRSSCGQLRHLSGPCTVGSGRDNDWVLADPFVSTRHLMLVPDGDRLRISDRGSRNGTYVNGVQLSQAVVGAGACITIGHTQLRLYGPSGPTRLLGDSAATGRVREVLQVYGPMALPVLIYGESGTGKDVVARALHEASGRTGAFVPLNCGALPRELIESELFGHEKGAFTGAHQRRAGCFAEAHGGTIFLDEIAELPLDLQPRLLRALESRAVRPVGGNREVPVDVRVIAATHCDLLDAVAAGRFRADLYYRLAGLDLSLPPLRERPGDLPALVAHFLAELAETTGPRTMAPDEVAQLARYPWPGNVRQLRHAIGRAAHLHGPTLRADDILGALPPPRGIGAAGGDGAIPILGRRFADIEREVYVAVLRQHRNNRRAAAAQLGVPKSTLCDKLRRFGVTD